VNVILPPRISVFFRCINTERPGGRSPTGIQVMPSGLNIMEMIKC
jgi:hypothetical protein